MIKQEQKDMINRYTDLKIEIKRLEKEADELNIEVLSIMETNELGEIDVPTGKLTLKNRRTWKYGPELTQKETDLKAAQKLAQQTGVGADYTEKSYLLFKVDNDE